jgi:hypothetical protein
VPPARYQDEALFVVCGDDPAGHYGQALPIRGVFR